MSVTVVPLELEKFYDLPPHSRRCVFWEIDRDTEPDAFDTGSFAAPSVHAVRGGAHESEFDKEAWVSGLLLEWGTCAQVAVETTTGTIVGVALYAPPGRVPRARRFPTAPVGSDAILLTTISTAAGFDDAAIHLIDAVVTDLVQRGVRAVEAFGYSGSDEPLERDLLALTLGNGVNDDACHECLIPTQQLVDAGFQVVADDPYLPRLRLELDEGLSWKSAVERALEKLVVEAAVDLSGVGVAVG